MGDTLTIERGGQRHVHDGQALLNRRYGKATGVVGRRTEIRTVVGEGHIYGGDIVGADVRVVGHWLLLVGLNGEQ